MINKHGFCTGMAAGEGGADSPSLYTSRSKSYPKATFGSLKGESHVISCMVVHVFSSLLLILVIIT